jgi:arylsulfatase A-like enzyme
MLIFRPGRALFPALLLILFAGCGRGDDRPNVLFIVWDTTRADRMSLYGYEKPTTPFLDSWAAEEALVFENCASTANATIPSHGAIFTGLFPSEHGANTRFNLLDDRFETLAEIFRDGGYETYLFSANPHISSDENFTQGFDRAEHPWDKKYTTKTDDILRRKTDPRELERRLPKTVHPKEKIHLRFKATGELAEKGLSDWLETRDGKGPFFAYLNYMEAHQPYIPAEEARNLFMTPDQVERFLAIDYSPRTLWEHTFGLKGYKPEEIELTGLAYDACISELDDLFRILIAALEKSGNLDNTIVVLTSDHGEQIGEHHMLGHQYSLYEELLRVPLVLRVPGRVAPGRNEDPVVNFDLFPTLLGLAGFVEAHIPERRTVSLLKPQKDRMRVAECPADFDWPIKMIGKFHNNWNPAPYRCRLTALRRQELKLIITSDGRSELYDLADDPAETKDLATERPGDLRRMADELQRITGGFEPFDYKSSRTPAMTEEQKKRLEALGYLGGQAATGSEKER